MSHHAKLTSRGFTALPALDPSYFDYRDGVGYFVLFNEELGKYYQGFTHNAKDLATSVIDVIKGRRRNRAIDLIRTLKGTVVEDWELYFKSGPAQVNARAQISLLLEDYTQIRRGVARLDENQKLTLWYIEDTESQFKRLVYIPEDQTLEDAMARYLLLWRKTFHSALREGTITLSQYYKAADQHAVANSNWMSGDNSQFRSGQLTAIGALIRSRAVERTKHQNNNYTNEYFEKLFRATPRKKEVLGLED